MKKLTEPLLQKDTTIIKTQFDREWFYVVKDLEDYLNEDLNGVETVTLPIEVDGKQYTFKCTTWEDLQRFLEKDPVESFRGSVLKNRKKG